MLGTYGFHFKLFEKIEIKRPEIKAKFLNKKKVKYLVKHLTNLSYDFRKHWVLSYFLSTILYLSFIKVLLKIR